MTKEPCRQKLAYCGADHVSSLKPGKMVLPGGTGRERRELMEPFTYCKLEIFIPETHLKALQKALQEVDAGHIGKYDSCMSVSYTHLRIAQQGQETEKNESIGGIHGKT